MRGGRVTVRVARRVYLVYYSFPLRGVADVKCRGVFVAS